MAPKPSNGVERRLTEEGPQIYQWGFGLLLFTTMKWPVTATLHFFICSTINIIWWIPELQLEYLVKL